MARQVRVPDRSAAAVRFPPPLIPLFTVLAGAGLQRILPVEVGSLLAAPARHWLGGGIAVAAFLLFGVWPVVLFRRSGQSPIPWRPTPSIVERGPYRVTRNPMYLQMVLICVGLAVAFATAWILALTPLCVWLLQKTAILPEEAYLEREFGDEYRGYKSRVRRWL